jgi:DNA-binding GntR family transcriptional regulator
VVNEQANEMKKPLAFQAYQTIQEKIITLEFEPGRQLDERRLVSLLGIGRTPIREALVRLASEYLVESQPNRGFVVRPLTFQSVKSMFEALRILELGTATLAVQQDTTAWIRCMEEANQTFEKAIKKNELLKLVWNNHYFHMHFAKCSANDYLVRALREVRTEVNRLAYLSFRGQVSLDDDLLKHYRSVVEEHQKMMLYLKKKDLDRLKEIIEIHIKTFQQRIVRYLTA